MTPATMCEGVEPMGRGRAKAKQTKVARELKYREFNTDFTELQRELHGDADHAGPPANHRASTDVDSERLDEDPFPDLDDEVVPRR
jgi:hypothetical protein